MFFDTSPVIVDVRTTACSPVSRFDDHDIRLEAKPGDRAVVDAVAHVGAGEDFGSRNCKDLWSENDIVSVASRIGDPHWKTGDDHPGVLWQARERPDHGIVQVVVENGHRHGSAGTRRGRSTRRR